MDNRKIKSFYTEVNTTSIRSGAASLLQSVGLGKLRPNTLLMGFKNNWRSEPAEAVLDYFGIFNDAFEMKFGVCVLKLENGLDYSDFFEEAPDSSGNESESEAESEDRNIEDSYDSMVKKRNIESLIEKKNRSNWNVAEAQRDLNNNGEVGRGGGEGRKKDSVASMAKGTDLIMLKGTKINRGLLQGLNMFHRKQQNGFVDVWWLFDDGGLTLLLPYLLLQRKYWKNCKLRIFIETKSADAEISEEQRK